MDKSPFEYQEKTNPSVGGRQSQRLKKQRPEIVPPIGPQTRRAQSPNASLADTAKSDQDVSKIA